MRGLLRGEPGPGRPGRVKRGKLARESSNRPACFPRPFHRRLSSPTPGPVAPPPRIRGTGRPSPTWMIRSPGGSSAPPYGRRGRGAFGPDLCGPPPPQRATPLPEPSRTGWPGDPDRPEHGPGPGHRAGRSGRPTRRPTHAGRSPVPGRTGPARAVRSGPSASQAGATGGQPTRAQLTLVSARRLSRHAAVACVVLDGQGLGVGDPPLLAVGLGDRQADRSATRPADRRSARSASRPGPATRAPRAAPAIDDSRGRGRAHRPCFVERNRDAGLTPVPDSERSAGAAANRGASSRGRGRPRAGRSPRR